MSFRSRLPILSFILRHNSKIKNFRQEVCYGDEVVEKKNPVSKKSRILTSTTTQIYDGTSSGSRFPELSADDHNFLYVYFNDVIQT
ncbi:hypothetical protein D915_010613 [Fasciola hepatica]|uniref:Uncharacterized protein n=1 Tax=Fasciola hepatica TaxID=6192 RepID=A0A4E0RPJ9_FASHE|nr:hypothetical protein D915_010613 [Fasciola hepatica]